MTEFFVVRRVKLHGLWHTLKPSLALLGCFSTARSAECFVMMVLCFQIAHSNFRVFH